MAQAQDWWNGCCAFWGFGSLEGQYTFSQVPNPDKKRVELETTAAVTAVQALCRNKGGNIGSFTTFLNYYPLPVDTTPFTYIPGKGDKQKGTVIANPEIETADFESFIASRPDLFCTSGQWSVESSLVSQFEATITVYAYSCDAYGECSRVCADPTSCGDNGPWVIYEVLTDLCTLNPLYSVLNKDSIPLFDETGGKKVFDCDAR